MQEISFKGFYKDVIEKEKIFFNGEWIKGKWVHGGTWKNAREQRFITEDNGYNGFSIIPKTVCQKFSDICWYCEETQTMDEQIKDAWQNDVIQIRMSDGTEHIGFVDIEFGHLIFVSNDLPDGYINLCEFSEELDEETFEVVDEIMYIKAKYLGNRFENGELLGDNYESDI